MSPTPVRLNAGLTQTVFLLDEVLIASPKPVRLDAGMNYKPFNHPVVDQFSPKPVRLRYYFRFFPKIWT